MKISLPILLALACTLLSCHTEIKEEAELLELFRQEKKLDCRLTAMKDSITLEWDNTNRILKDNLPAQIPENEKRNLLKVRNANLIRMFRTYTQLDTSVKIVVNQTALIDRTMTQHINELKEQSRQLQSKKIQLLIKVNQSHGPDELNRLQRLNQAYMSDPCMQPEEAQF